ncbi:NAD-dependent epimerase/dehydratase family protein [Janthinobacterium sp. SUN206]|uniref:NAD-dependent epimerase/dehydratase family protein n=1 Tax=Janthinobacterium sp. SUN206 TaxID=3014787 RepID=UPI0027138BB7|nr:NAD-dependent epimerase/dehydratase family protein [Janthinobacterium sp. SUN206]MDO8066644.1 NAD(P)H-binding protein [Janthinobacterium sp. SUN206]
MDNTKNTALVLGATGGIGGEMLRQLLAAGWQVRALTRGETPPPRGDRIEWLRGDALSRADVLAAAKGCAVIVHAVNPPGYRHWGRLVLPMLDNTIAAAIAENATIVLPGTVYNFGPDAFPVLTEDAQQRPLTRKGAIRVALEARLEWAATQGARVLIVRAGDFFGPRAGNNWFSQGLVKPGQPVRSILYPGAPGVGHQWSYLPDVARTMVRLLAMRAALPAFARFHMAGHWDHDGRQMTGAIARAVEQATGAPPVIRRFPWWLVALASPFVATLREMREMRYLWQTPLSMDNAQLLAVLGQEAHTPLDEAVRATLEGMGNLKATDKKNAPGLPAR